MCNTCLQALGRWGVRPFSAKPYICVFPSAQISGNFSHLCFWFWVVVVFLPYYYYYFIFSFLSCASKYCKAAQTLFSCACFFFFNFYFILLYCCLFFRFVSFLVFSCCLNIKYIYFPQNSLFCNKKVTWIYRYVFTFGEFSFNFFFLECVTSISYSCWTSSLHLWT